MKVVFADVIAEPGVGFALFAQERCAGEGEVLGVGQTGTHVFGEGFVLGAVGLIDDDDDVVAGGKDGILLAFVVAEFVDEGEDDALVLAEEGTHLLAVLGAGGFGFGDGVGVEEVAVDLPV